jgi:hypothetical protein
MPYEEEFIKKALDIFHQVQQGIDPNEFNQQTKQLFETIKEKPLHKLISLNDLQWAIKDDTFFRWDIALKDVTNERFTERFKHTILTTKTYEFYIPIYCLYDFPKNLLLGSLKVIDFRDIPEKIQEFYVERWKFRFRIDSEYHHNEDEYVNLKKKSTFLYLVLKANGGDKASKKVKDMAEDALHIIRFVYEINFNLIDVDYWVKETGDSSGCGIVGLARLPFCGVASYDNALEKSLKILSSIFYKKDPNDIEERVKRAIRIYGTQESIISEQVRFLLLITCLETLLMSKSDRDYILWRLAEKTAFVLGGNMQKTNDYIKDAYEKRSRYIHGDSKQTITDEDIVKAKKIVGDLIWKLIIAFVKNGYTQVAKGGDPKKRGKIIDEYVEQLKFSF